LPTTARNAPKVCATCLYKLFINLLLDPYDFPSNIRLVAAPSAGVVVRAQNEKPIADELPAEVRPIEFVTENGFSILRQWEIDRGPLPKTRTFLFVIRHSGCEDQEVVVEISDDVLRQLSIRVLGRILSCTPFWVCCAERHLATYLWEKDACPAGNRLVIERFDPEEIILATRWGQKKWV
jgi:hypothetical protein